MYTKLEVRLSRLLMKVDAEEEFIIAEAGKPGQNLFGSRNPKHGGLESSRKRSRMPFLNFWAKKSRAAGAEACCSIPTSFFCRSNTKRQRYRVVSIDSGKQTPVPSTRQ